MANTPTENPEVEARRLAGDLREWARILTAPDFDAGEFPYKVAARSLTAAADALDALSKAEQERVKLAEQLVASARLLAEAEQRAGEAERALARFRLWFEVAKLGHVYDALGAEATLTKEPDADA